MRLTFWLLALLVITSCESTKEVVNDPDDYLIFGHFYGFCQGETCIETYKLTDTQLFEDQTDDYAKQQPYNFVALSTDKFDAVKNLKNLIPSELLNKVGQTFGCPDCADQGGIYIELQNNSETVSWRIDHSKNQVPAYLHNFMDEVTSSINLLDTLTSDDYLIFGYHGGFAGNLTNETYKLTSSQLFEAQNPIEPFNFVPLSNSKFLAVQDLTSFIPAQLLSNTQTEYRCANCADLREVYLEIKANGTIRQYRIDDLQSEVPAYLHDFMNKIADKIELINN